MGNWLISTFRGYSSGKLGKGNYVVGANIAGFTKVADAMVAQGVC